MLMLIAHALSLFRYLHGQLINKHCISTLSSKGRGQGRIQREGGQGAMAPQNRGIIIIRHLFNYISAHTRACQNLLMHIDTVCVCVIHTQTYILVHKYTFMHMNTLIHS